MMSEPIKVGDLVICVKNFCPCNQTKAIGRPFEVKSVLRSHAHCDICQSCLGENNIISDGEGRLFIERQLKKIDGFDPNEVEQEDLELAI